MKIIFFSLALICATSLVCNTADTIKKAVAAVEIEEAGCAICTRCEICGKEIHDDANDDQDASEVKCGCNKPNRSGCAIDTRCEICGKETHDDADEDINNTDKCGCGKK